MSKQSKALTKFYQEYHAWVEAGTRRHSVFVKATGLCATLRFWCYRNNVDLTITDEMAAQFHDANLDSDFPFSCTDYEDLSVEYMIESESCTMHLNPRRIPWVKDHADINPLS